VKLFGRKLGWFPRVLVVLAAILLLASGICGIDSAIEAHHGWYSQGPWPETSLANLLGSLDLVSFAVILLSIGGVLLTACGWMIQAIFRSLKHHSRPN
jgi:hypothetical protein